MQISTRRMKEAYISKAIGRTWKDRSLNNLLHDVRKKRSVHF